MKMTSIYNIPYPDRHPWDACEACEHGRIYDSTEDAFQHLVREHYYKIELTEKNANALSFLVQSVEEMWMIGIRQAHCALLEVILKHLDSLHKEILSLRVGLATSIDVSPPPYTLPDDMIQVLERLVEFILVCSRTANLMDCAYSTWVPTESNGTSILKVNDYIDFVDRFGTDIEGLLIHARAGIRSMVTDHISTLEKPHRSVGMRYLSSNVLKNLLVQPLVQPLVHDCSKVEFYLDNVSRLVGNYS